MTRRTITVALLCLAAAGQAQAPRVTSAGDPSVNADTIYALRVDPKRFADEPFVYLLDDGIGRFDADGRGSTTFRQVVQILTHDGVTRWAEQSITYHPPWERLSINWVRVLDSAGRLAGAPPPHEQDSRPDSGTRGAVSTAPVVRRLSIGGVMPGTILDISWTIEVVKPFIYGDYYAGWRILNGHQTQRSRFIVDLPMNSDIQIAEQHVAVHRIETFANGRQVYVWAAQDLRKPDSEMFVPDSATGSGVAVAAARRWIEVSKSWARWSNHHYELDSGMAAQIVTRLRDAGSRDDTLRRLFRWAASDKHCDTFEPAPAHGEYRLCEDRASLFIAGARWVGYESYPVLLALAAPIDTSFPTLRQFDHLIAAVKRSDDEYEFADLVAHRAAFGDLPKYEQGKFGMLIHDDGTYDPVRLPEPPVPANRIQVSFIGDLDPSGGFKGRWTSSLTGNARYRAAVLMESSILPDSNARASCTRSFADSLRAKHVPDSLPSLDAAEMPSEVRIAIHACDSRIVSDAGGVKLLELPLVDLSNRRLVAMLEGSGPRRMPIDAGKASGEFEFVEELQLTLPPGWHARLPRNVTATSVFGAYEAVYAQTGRELDVRRRYTGARGVYPASSYGELIAWLNAKAADDVKVIVIDH